MFSGVKFAFFTFFTTAEYPDIGADDEITDCVVVDDDSDSSHKGSVGDGK
jgi:hypothetical protein